MKRLKFIELWLLSTNEGKARNEKIDDVTAVVAPNEFGKSSLVKSLYWTLGADPRKIPDEWTKAQVNSLLSFTVDDTPYYMLRYGPLFSLFDGNRKLLWSVSGTTKGLPPLLSELLDFNMEVIAKKGGEVLSPNPAMCFMPFYIDQDRGWTESWESFVGMDWVSTSKDDLANFHTGIRPKEYYAAKATRAEASLEKAAAKQDRDALSRAEARIRDKRTSVGVAFEPDVFADRIDALLIEQNALQKTFDDAKIKVAEEQSLRAMAFEEMEVAKRVMSELEADAKFLESIDDRDVRCPTCNTVHKNDFASRYGLLNDVEACRAIYAESLKRVSEYDARIRKELRNVSGIEERVARISDLLAATRGDIKLEDMLRDESARMMDQAFSDEGRLIDKMIGEIERRMDAAQATMKEFDKAKHKKAIKDFYSACMRKFCAELRVARAPDDVFSKIRPVIKESGSSQARLFLAYYFAILHTVAKFSTAFFGPIVIDTPKQQDPDEENARAMIQFCIEHRPKGAQVILASGSVHGVAVPGRIIEPEERFSVLRREQFDDVNKFMKQFIDAVIH
ncbi:hypothetical protein [Rhizobium redzepovicii]